MASFFLPFSIHAKKTCPFMKRENKPSVLEVTFSFRYSYKKGSVDGLLESHFQSQLIKELKGKFPGCIVMKNDPDYIQGIPDLTILYKNKWATLECKKDAGARRQPNQDYYVGLMNEMSFSRFISPDNKEEVLHELQQAFGH